MSGVRHRLCSYVIWLSSLHLRMISVGCGPSFVDSILLFVYQVWRGTFVVYPYPLCGPFEFAVVSDNFLG